MSVLFIKVTLLENTAPHDIVAKRDKAVTYPAVFLFPQGFPDGTYISLIIIGVIGSGAFLIGICGQIVCRVHLFDQKTSPVIDKSSFHDTIGVRYLYQTVHAVILIVIPRLFCLPKKDSLSRVFFLILLETAVFLRGHALEHVAI